MSYLIFQIPTVTPEVVGPASRPISYTPLTFSELTLKIGIIEKETIRFVLTLKIIQNNL